MEKELEKIKSITLKENAKDNLKEIKNKLKEEIEDFFYNANYDDLKELINLVVDKVIVPKNKKSPVRIIMKIPCNNISFAEKYYEEETINYIDEDEKEHIVSTT
jgi:predicted house-cleaning noncanonical NTP pyrophosphatase (MazG superfamily)